MTKSVKSPSSFSYRVSTINNYSLASEIRSQRRSEELYNCGNL
jgi:hypothetical protein